MNKELQFGELKTEIKKCGFETLRGEDAVYFETVLIKTQVPGVMQKLQELLGTALWPSDGKIPPAINKVIADFGGIMGKQTLFGFEANGRVVFAMLWPWNDGLHVTLKMGEK